MPYRDLPNTDAKRTTALSALFTKAAGVVDADLPFPVILRGQINALQPLWLGELGDVSEALGVQTGLTGSVEPLAAEFDLVFNHFVQVFHLGVRRGVFQRSDRTFYGMGVNQSDVPSTSRHVDRVLWAGRIAAGEAQRLAANPTQPPMSMPSAAQVAAAFAAYMAAHTAQSTAKETYDEEQEDVQGLRPQVDALVLEAWDQMEFTYRRESGPSRRRKCREWGVVYIPRPGEEPDEEEPPTPEPPAAPTGASFVQGENPGDAVEAAADAVAGATLWKIFQRAAGSSDAPELVASAAALPTSFTLAPGDYEFTLTVTTAAGESAPSAPVTITVA